MTTPSPTPQLLLADVRQLIQAARQRVAETFPDEQILSTVRRELSWSHLKTLIYIDEAMAPKKREAALFPSLRGGAAAAAIQEAVDRHAPCGARDDGPSPIFTRHSQLRAPAARANGAKGGRPRKSAAAEAA